MEPSGAEPDHPDTIQGLYSRGRVLVPSSIESTERVEPARAFDFWRSTALSRVDAEPLVTRNAFAASRLVVPTPHGTLIHTRSSPLTIERRPWQVRQDSVDLVAVALFVRGSGRHQQGRHSEDVAPGDVFVADFERPFMAAAEETYEELRLHVPRATFRTLVGDAASLAGRPLLGERPLVHLFGLHLQAIAASVARMSATEAALALEGALHLLQGAVRGETERGAAGADAEVSTAGLRTLAQAYIARRLHDPALDPAAICNALCVSRSRLYAAFADTGGVAAAIRDARLDRVHARLSARAEGGGTIAEVAYACGFTDIPSFGRAFRRRFGLTPRDLRGLRGR